MSHLNLLKRIHEPHEIKWVQGEITFIMKIDDRFIPFSYEKEPFALKKTNEKNDKK